MPVSLNDRTRVHSDPVRNFKFQVELFHPDAMLHSQIGQMGFMTVDGLAMNTEMVAYREGGWNTNPHKLPGQTDFSPVTMSAGVFYQKPGMWNLARQMFSVQWGSGTIGVDEEFRFDMAIRVLDHPVTKEAGSGSVAGDKTGYVMAFAFYNAWVASVAFNNLAAMDNAVLIHQMTVHHEGFDAFFGREQAANLSRNTFIEGGGSRITVS